MLHFFVISSVNSWGEKGCLIGWAELLTSDIFISESGINISVVGNIISIQEIVPNNRLDNYSSAINNFKLFVEEREQYVAIDNAGVDETELIIMPVNSSFYNDEIDSNAPIRYIENFVNVNDITFHVYRSDIPVEDIFWQEFIPGPTRVTAIKLAITAISTKIVMFLGKIYLTLANN